MEKLNKYSQMLKVLVIASLLIITPLLSTSDRSKYLYFILNILILLVGAEAGLLSFLLHNDKLIFSSDDHNRNVQTNITVPADHVNKEVEKPCSESEENIVNVDGVKPPTLTLTPTPSIFFIGGVDEEDEEKEEVEEEEEMEEEEEELFQKAEKFIGNFYKQLKMQREESWNKLSSSLSY